MILFVYSVILSFMMFHLSKYIHNLTSNKITDEESLPKIILVILFYNKLLTSMQIIGAVLFFSGIQPLNMYLYLPQYKIIF